jgi:hypothetical protein
MAAGSRCRLRPCECPHRHRRSRRSRLDERNGVRDRPSRDFLAIHRQDARAAFAETGTVVLEIKHDGMLARRQRRWAFPPEAFHVKKVVHKDWFALEQVETMATAAAPERMKELFMVEAAKYSVFPLDNSFTARAATPRPSATAGRNLGGEVVRKVRTQGRPKGFRRDCQSNCKHRLWVRRKSGRNLIDRKLTFDIGANQPISGSSRLFEGRSQFGSNMEQTECSEKAI